MVKDLGRGECEIGERLTAQKWDQEAEAEAERERGRHPGGIIFKKT